MEWGDISRSAVQLLARKSQHFGHFLEKSTLLLKLRCAYFLGQAKGMVVKIRIFPKGIKSKQKTVCSCFVKSLTALCYQHIRGGVVWKAVSQTIGWVTAFCVSDMGVKGGWVTKTLCASVISCSFHWRQLTSVRKGMHWTPINAMREESWLMLTTHPWSPWQPKAICAK